MSGINAPCPLLNAARQHGKSTGGVFVSSSETGMCEMRVVCHLEGGGGSKPGSVGGCGEHIYSERGMSTSALDGVDVMKD